MLPMCELALLPLQCPPSMFHFLCCAASGEHLDAGAVLAALLAGRQHAARQGAVVRSLRKAAHLAAASTRAEVPCASLQPPLRPLRAMFRARWQHRLWAVVLRLRLLSLAGFQTAASWAAD